MSTAVEVSREDQVMHVRLNRVDKLNAFNAELVEGLHEAMVAASVEATRVVVFTGLGKGFSGGFDLDGLDEMTNGDLLHRFVRVEQLLQDVYHAPFATLAMVHGVCYGAAADLVAACHFRVAAPDARFRMPGLRFGIVLGTRRLAGLVGGDTAKTLLLRDTPFDSSTALDTGFVQEIAAQDDWPEIVQNRLSAVTALSQSAYAAMAGATRNDTRDEDMAALVRSVTDGSIKDRIRRYLDAIRQARKA